MALTPEKIAELKIFCEALKASPQLLHLPELDFFRKFLQSYGGRIPVVKTANDKPKEECPAHDHDNCCKPSHSEKHPETHQAAPPAPAPVPMEIVDNDLMQPDNDAPLDMGDASIEVTEEKSDEAMMLKSNALKLYKEGQFQESVNAYTLAIKCNPQSAILFASRAQVLLDMKKPNAAIRDCDKSISLNPDSAKGYKYRGKARRYLGKYDLALKDVQLGLKLDWEQEFHALELELKKFLNIKTL